VQHRDLVAKDQDLDLVRPLTTKAQHDQLQGEIAQTFAEVEVITDPEALARFPDGELTEVDIDATITADLHRPPGGLHTRAPAMPAGRSAANPCASRPRQPCIVMHLVPAERGDRERTGELSKRDDGCVG
jgi:hypothetical protein